MKHSLAFDIQPQPDNVSCGPTCLAAVYRYWNDDVDLHRLIGEIGQLSGGGTLAVQLACHALARGYDAQITTYNLQLFDPTWFQVRGHDSAVYLAEKLVRQRDSKTAGMSGADRERLESATESYLRFLSLGGKLKMEALDSGLILSNLKREIPILCGLSATFLYQEARERPASPLAGASFLADDIAGEPTGHFVVLHGFDPASGNVQIADPLHPNPIAATSNYAAALSQVISAILLGILTYDANLLTLIPRTAPKEETQ